MWPFTTKYNISKIGFMQGMTDFHSHVLPGVDDGIKDINDTFKVLRVYEEQGVDTLWFTPHIMEDVPNTTAGLRDCFNYVCQHYNGPLKLRLAAENMLDNLFEYRIETRDVLPIGESGQHLLVETSYYTPPSDFYDKLSRASMAGFIPLLAHPERYMYMDLEDYDELKERGIKLQLNLSSLFGFYGKEALKKAKYILENGYYDAIGTDTHRFSQVMIALERGALSKKHLNMLSLVPGID